MKYSDTLNSQISYILFRKMKISWLLLEKIGFLHCILISLFGYLVPSAFSARLFTRLSDIDKDIVKKRSGNKEGDSAKFETNNTLISAWCWWSNPRQARIDPYEKKTTRWLIKINDHYTVNKWRCVFCESGSLFIISQELETSFILNRDKTTFWIIKIKVNTIPWVMKKCWPQRYMRYRIFF